LTGASNGFHQASSNSFTGKFRSTKMAVYREKVALRRLFLRIFTLHIGDTQIRSALLPIAAAASG